MGYFVWFGLLFRLAVCFGLGFGLIIVALVWFGDLVSWRLGVTLVS